MIEDVQEGCSKNTNTLLEGKCGGESKLADMWERIDTQVIIAKFDAKKAPDDVAGGKGNGKDGLPDYYSNGFTKYGTGSPTLLVSIILIVSLFR